MKIIAGYRSSDSDRVMFHDESESNLMETASAIRTIDPSQLVTIGDVVLDGDEPECDESPSVGEWGRMGPRRRSGIRELAMIPAETALTAEDAAARHILFQPQE